MRGQNHVLCCFYQKYGTWVAHTAPILSTNWFYWFRKQFGWFSCQWDLFMTQGSCKNTSKCKEIEFWGVKIMFYAIFTRNMGLGWPILRQSWVQIGFIDLENNLDDLKAILYRFWDHEVAKIRHYVRKLSFERSKSCFMLFLPKIWDLGGPYCTNLEYKLILLI